MFSHRFSLIFTKIHFYSLDVLTDGVDGICKSSFNSVYISISIFKQNISTDLHFDLYANFINSVKPPHNNVNTLK